MFVVHFEVRICSIGSLYSKGFHKFNDSIKEKHRIFTEKEHKKKRDQIQDKQIKKKRKTMRELGEMLEEIKFNLTTIKVLEDFEDGLKKQQQHMKVDLHIPGKNVLL